LEKNIKNLQTFYISFSQEHVKIKFVKENIMSKTWKWILGIVIVLVVVAAAAFAARGFYVSHHMITGNFNRFEGPMGRNYDDFRHPMKGYRGFQHPMIGNYGYMMLPFMFVGGFLRLLFPLLVLGAVGYFFYQRGKKAGMAVANGPASKPAHEDPPSEEPKRKGRKVAKED